MSAPPSFSIITPVYHPDPGQFREMLDSVVSQTLQDWEVVLSFDGTHDRVHHDVVAEFGDPRIVIVEREQNEGISVASNHAMERAVGEFVVLLDHDDTLAPFALEAVAEVLDRWPDTDVVYSDEDKLDPDGNRVGPFCKPGFSPDWLRCHMYLNHLGAYRRSLVSEVGGFRPEFDGAQDHDLALRCTERARRVAHIPRVLYHWRQAESSTAADPETKSWAYDAGVRVVQDALERQGIPASARRRPGYSGIVDLEPRLEEPPKVSIVVPTAGGRRLVCGEELRLVERCLASIRERTSYDDYEVVVIVDRSAEPGLEDSLRRSVGGERLRFVRNHRPFNFSEACNLGREHADGEVLVFLNDDTEIVTPEWLDRLVLFTTMDGVGAVGVKLLYSDGRIQHIGLVSRSGVGHRSMGVSGDHIGPYGSYTTPTNVLAVTGACLAVTTADFDHVGGFTPQFPLSFNDVDFCLKLLQSGRRTVLDPCTVVTHHESSSRDPHVSPTELDRLFDRWQHLLDDDPYDNPALRHGNRYAVEQEQPPGWFLQLRELTAKDRSPARVWPLGETPSGSA